MRRSVSRNLSVSHRFHFHCRLCNACKDSFQVPPQCCGCIFNCMQRPPFLGKLFQVFVRQRRKVGHAVRRVPFHIQALQRPQRQWNAISSICQRWKKSCGDRVKGSCMSGADQYYVTEDPPHCHWQDITVKWRSRKCCLNITLKSHHLTTSATKYVTRKQKSLSDFTLWWPFGTTYLWVAFGCWTIVQQR